MQLPLAKVNDIDMQLPLEKILETSPSSKDFKKTPLIRLSEYNNYASIVPRDKE